MNISQMQANTTEQVEVYQTPQETLAVSLFFSLW